MSEINEVNELYENTQENGFNEIDEINEIDQISELENISQSDNIDETSEILNLIDSEINFNDIESSVNESEVLFNLVNNDLKYNDIDVDIDNNITENPEDYEEIVFANLKNFYQSEYDTNVMEDKRHDISLLDIDISFNDFSTLFYSSNNHHFNISIGNRFNRYLFFNKQFVKTTEDLTERFDLTRIIKKLWTEKHSLALSSMQPQQSIRIVKECKKILSLYNLKGTTVALSLTEIIDEILDILKNQETVTKIKCLLHSDIFIRSSDIYIRLVWPYNVSFNTANVDDFGIGEVLGLEDI